jgi:lactate dehydrogenase-like 2-hydroxyacid dehydrogenase
MAQVVVTDLEYRKAQKVFSAAAASGLECVAGPAGEAELAALAGRLGIKYLVVGVEPYRGPLYEALPRGGVIARFGVGHDGIDKALATQRGILCTNTPGALDDSVAEHAINLLLAAARGTITAAGGVKVGQWVPTVGRELAGRTLAVIGCGPIGRRVAQIASTGFRMRVVGCELLDVDAEAMRREFGFARITKDFGDAVADADYVTLHIPSVTATRYFINRERFSRMPAKAWLINTARGAIVDETALYEALVAGMIGGAALDVFEREPYCPVDPDKDLRTLRNVIMTPHIGSSTQEACDRMATQALQNIQAAVENRHDRMDILNPQVVASLRGTVS